MNLKTLKDKRKAEILSKIMNEEKDLERRKIQNPTLFMTNEHLLPRPSDVLGQFFVLDQSDAGKILTNQRQEYKN